VSCALSGGNISTSRPGYSRCVGASGSAARGWGRRTPRTTKSGAWPLDPETLAVLAEHRRRWEQRVAALGVELRDDAFVFSLAPDGSAHLQPDSVSQRYGDLVKRLGIHTSIHKLRHYSATELISAGVDALTVAGRLGHGGGGTTTLRYYTAWVSESGKRAASTLTARMPGRPADGQVPPRAGSERATRTSCWPTSCAKRSWTGTYPAGAFLPGQKVLAADCGVSVGRRTGRSLCLQSAGTSRSCRAGAPCRGSSP